MRYPALLLVVIVVSLTACHHQGVSLIESDIDDLVAAGQSPLGVTTEAAHSGRHSLKIATGAEFAGGIVRPLGLGGFVPRRVRLRAWVNLRSGRIRTTYLTLSIRCRGRRGDPWLAIPLQSNVLRFNKWEKVEQVFSLPADLLPTDNLEFSCWHAEADGDVTYVDDVRVDALP